MASQARQFTRVGVPSRTGGTLSPAATTYPANAPSYVSGVIAAGGTSPNAQQLKANTPGSGQTLTFSLPSGALTEGFSITGNLVYYQNPNTPKSSPIAVAKISSTGTLTATSNVISTPVYGSVGGKNTYLGSVQYVPSVSGSNIGFTYSGFTGASVSETYKVYVPDYAIGQYIPVGVTVGGSTSYNPATNHVSVNFPGFYGPGTAPLPPSNVFLTPQTTSGNVFGLPSNIGVQFNETVTFNTGGGVTTSATPTGSFSLGGKVSHTVSTTETNAGGSQTTTYSVAGGQIFASTERPSTIFQTNTGAIGVASYTGITYYSPATPIGQYYLKMLGPLAPPTPTPTSTSSSTIMPNAAGYYNLGASDQNGLIGGNVVPINGVFIPPGGGATTGLSTFENKVVVGGKTYNVNFGNNLNTISSGPGSSPGVTLSLVSHQTTFATTSTSMNSA